MATPRYKRILLKLSGEALTAPGKGILDFDFIAKVADVLKRCKDDGVEIGVIVGAGNIWRGRQGGKMDRKQADHMGMLATAINALALQDSFLAVGLDAVVMSAVEMRAFTDTFTVQDANAALKAGKVVIFACGLGQPFFSTDTAAVLRAAEIDADAVLMAKNIDGIYSADPKVDPTATRYDEITYKEVLEKELKALDLSATTFCMENDIRCYAFALNDPDNIYHVVMGEHIGTELHR
ncbi:MAG: UMP kinase [Clostridia bacterium]|nr:UMP kinase [Clostridia bacterium]MBQ9131928.1 UMP kinase [Clostridia bacterium]